MTFMDNVSRIQQLYLSAVYASGSKLEDFIYNLIILESITLGEMEYENKHTT